MADVCLIQLLSTQKGLFQVIRSFILKMLSSSRSLFKALTTTAHFSGSWNWRILASNIFFSLQTWTVFKYFLIKFKANRMTKSLNPAALQPEGSNLLVIWRSFLLSFFGLICVSYRNWELRQMAIDFVSVFTSFSSCFSF